MANRTRRSSISALAGIFGAFAACSSLVSCSTANTSGAEFNGGTPDGGDASVTDGQQAGDSSSKGGLAEAGSFDASVHGGDAADADGGAAGGMDATARDATATQVADSGLHEAGSAGGDSGAGSDSGVAASGPLPGGLAAFPPPNGQNVCADAPLRVIFPGPPTLGKAGKIQVFDASQPATAVAVVDMAGTSFTTTIDAMVFNTLRPVYVDGNVAVIYLPSHPLAYGKTYYVTVDSGALVGPTGTAVSITGSTTWRFSTASAAPPASSSLAVALDGSAPFCSVQGALDAVPANNRTAVAVTLRAGTYHEIVHFSAKSDVTLQGADRTTTIISATNNNNLNPSTVGRSLVGVDNSSGLIVQNLTIENTTPQGGSQAEALRLESCDECVVRNANIISRQDTILWDGRLYADNCYIAGNVDFVWGGGAAYFNNCQIKDVGEAGWNVQARNPAATYGYVFVDSQLTSDPGITGHGLARIDVSVYPASNVAYLNCQMGSHISPAGWTITGGTPTAALRFWEYQSVDPNGNPIDVSQRAVGSMQLTAAQAAMVRDPTVVLAGWQPPAN